MNILIASISTFSYKKQEREYVVRLSGCDVDTIKACHTNESVLRCLVHLSGIQQSGGLNKIIALVSNAAAGNQNADYDNMTAFQYYQSVMKECAPDAEIESVRIENDDNSPKDTAVILNEICEKIDTDDVVYIDGAGGLRTINNIIQLLTNIMKYKGIVNPCTLYSDIQNIPNFIADTSDFIGMTDLADAFNEFMTTGKAKQLNQFFLGSDVPECVSSLLKSMNEFSDQIRLNRVGKIGSVVEKLEKSISECQNIDLTSSKEIGLVILKQFLPVIKQKLIGDTENGVNYLTIIKWCLNNDLIQQAMTIYEAKIPVYIFNKGIIRYNGDVRHAKQEYLSKKNNKIAPEEWENYAFYTVILSEIREADSARKELKDALLNSKPPKSSLVKGIIKSLNNLSFPVYSAADVPKNIMCLKLFLEQNRFTNSQKLKNVLANNIDLQDKLLGLKSSDGSSSDDNLYGKFCSIDEIKDGKTHPKFTFCVNKSLIARMYYAYIYVKNLRNKTNHAASKDVLPAEYMEVLSKYGYSSEDMTLESVKHNIKNAIDVIRLAENEIKAKKEA